MLKAIVFDFDGTLIDTTDSIWKEYLRVSGLMGLPRITYGQFARQLGKPWTDALLTLWPDVDIEEFNRLYRRNTEKSIPVPGLEATLNELGVSYRLAVLTSRGEKSLFQHLRALGLDPSIFDLILHKDSIKNHKPDPRALLHACEKLNSGPENVLYVGDSLIDLECALRAKIKFAGVLTGGASRKEFEKEGAEYIIDSIAQLPDMVPKIK